MGKSDGGRLTLQPNLEECALIRRAVHIRRYGHPPYVKWEPLTDTANTLYEQDVSGNITLPKTKADWAKKMSELRQKIQRLYIGGVGPNSVSNVYGCLDDEEVVEDVRMTMSGRETGLGRIQSGAYYSTENHISYRAGGRERT